MNTKNYQKTYEFEMTETMWGFMSLGASSFKEGYEEGKRKGNKLQYEVTLHVENFREFKSPSGRRAPMTGWVSCKNLFGEKLPIYNGEYGLYWVDPETGGRRISYDFYFKDKGGNEYHFFGYKVIVHEPWKLDMLEDQTTLYAKIGKIDGGGEKIVALGIIHYHVEDFADMVFSIRTPKKDNLLNRLRMSRKFFSFVSKEISEYFKEINPMYRAEYNNLVCKGIASIDSKDIEFFFFSGVHDKGFPWGDNVGFWDVALLIREGNIWRRFALTERAISKLKLRITEGTYTFEGHLFEITAGNQVSFKDMHRDQLPDHLRKVNVKIELRFKPDIIEKRNIPFEKSFDEVKKLTRGFWDKIKLFRDMRRLEKWRKDFNGLGYTTNIYRLTEIAGNFVVNNTNYSIYKNKTLGEGEIGQLAGLRNPKLYYNYFCGIEPEAGLFRVHIRSGILRSLSKDLFSNKAEELMGKVIGQFVRMDLQVKDEQKEDIKSEEADFLIVPQEDLLEINNDHYSTATFQRRVVTLPNSTGRRMLALEEDMSIINLESDRSSKITFVAAIKDPDRFNALDKVLEETGFFDLLDKTQRSSGKNKEDFSIIIKPNLSFMYSLTDISTFTDPNLVEHLVDRIYERGYRNISVAEAQSTYCIFFNNRDVLTLARYIGLSGKNYKIIDLSEDTVEHDYGRTLGKHEVHPEWRDADFRISFAKNKTHSYAFYTLTIKNIYGALPKKNKFKEYHCNEKLGIYIPAIDYIDEFPIHYGLIDGYISADGAFGIFADVEPNFTSTIIGGGNLVAVDWVGASKMGLDPMISTYMELAVERFGKPEIKLIGDHSLYTGWRNVPEFVSKAAFEIMDRNYTFGNFLYSVMATMDPFFRFKQDELYRRAARLFSEPLRKLLFEWVHGDREELTWEHLIGMFDRDQLEYAEELIKVLLE